MLSDPEPPKRLRSFPSPPWSVSAPSRQRGSYRSRVPKRASVPNRRTDGCRTGRRQRGYHRPLRLGNRCPSVTAIEPVIAATTIEPKGSYEPAKQIITACSAIKTYTQSNIEEIIVAGTAEEEGIESVAAIEPVGPRCYLRRRCYFRGRHRACRPRYHHRKCIITVATKETIGTVSAKKVAVEIVTAIEAIVVISAIERAIYTVDSEKAIITGSAELSIGAVVTIEKVVATIPGEGIIS